MWHFLNYSEHLKPSIRPWSANQCSSIERIGSKKKSFWTNKKFKLQTKFSPLRIKCSNDWSNYKIVYFQILFKRKNEEKSFSQSYFQFYFGFVKNCSQKYCFWNGMNWGKGWKNVFEYKTLNSIIRVIAISNCFRSWAW